jgi:hypothetical protein
VRTLFLSAVLVSTAALAAPPLVQESQPLDPRKNQKIEHIHVEDKAVRIDETRYAGQTESITVQPKDGLPAYEIQPATQTRQRLDDGRKPVGGERVWNVLAF